MKIENITKENVEEYFGKVFEFYNDGECVNFKTNKGSNEFYEILFWKDGIELPNAGNTGGGYIKDEDSCNDINMDPIRIENVRDVYFEIINGACDEDEGWVCY